MTKQCLKKMPKLQNKWKPIILPSLKRRSWVCQQTALDWRIQSSGRCWLSPQPPAKVEFSLSHNTHFVPSSLYPIEERGQYGMFTVYPLRWTAGLSWAAIAKPWANSHWREVDETGIQAKQRASEQVSQRFSLIFKTFINWLTPEPPKRLIYQTLSIWLGLGKRISYGNLP